MLNRILNIFRPTRVSRPDPLPMRKWVIDEDLELPLPGLKLHLPENIRPRKASFSLRTNKLVFDWIGERKENALESWKGALAHLETVHGSMDRFRNQRKGLETELEKAVRNMDPEVLAQTKAKYGLPSVDTSEPGPDVLSVPFSAEAQPDSITPPSDTPPPETNTPL